MANHSPHFPSDLEFGSFLTYPSPANTEAEKKAKTFILDLKRNAVTTGGSVVEIIVNRLAETVPGSCLADLLDGTAILVPVPGSSPLLRNAVWSTRDVCEAMVKRGLGRGTGPYLERVETIRKSAYCASRGVERPSPREHYDTMSIRRFLGDAPSIVLVDDVITRGATLLGAAARFLEAFPGVQIRAFAVSHTEKGMERWINPCRGHISSDAAGTWVNRVNDF